MTIDMAAIPLRDLKQNPSAVVARAEAGETIAVTVRGRHAATLIPRKPAHRWATPEDLEAYYDRIESAETPSMTVPISRNCASFAAGTSGERHPVVTTPLIDTNVVISRVGKPMGFDQLRVTSLTYAELEYGISSAAGRVAPRKNSFDLQIASVALANNLPLGTANSSDFAALATLIQLVAL